ncbi:hypothetical protein CA54_27680 [Symmachiella macrocystis]|uniref:Uncharacterized protein n=1 Tax=Symmachiella macrocystis TaxID=2527985 RepID=A0A5C6BRS2_9PLAN|nr:hypothetical protein [Symmachiella macrocystis]TWU13926.1 hypothetical protein CA54_27680 [Symmachiella macrocystis]
MKSTSFVLLLVTGFTGVAMLWSENSAQAQYRVRVGGARRWYRPGGYGYGGYGYGGWGWNSGASTVAGGYGEGMSQVIRAQGQANKDNAAAQLTREEARTKNIENNKKAADTYWAMKDRYRQQKEEGYQRDAERRAKNRANLESSSNGPRYQGLGPDDFDSVTGKILWPEVLQSPDFEEDRAKLDDLFEHLTLTGGAMGAKTSDEIKSTTVSMRETLKQHVSSMPSADYIAARKFIDGLAYEGRS